MKTLSARSTAVARLTRILTVAILAALSLAVPAALGQPCVGDVNHDYQVGLQDLVLVLSNFGLDEPEAACDLDGDGAVGLSDLALLLRAFGEPCPAPPGMAVIPAGEFLMGNSFPGEGSSDELPRHAVYIDALFMDVFEVTNAQYAAALNWAWNQGDQITVIDGVVYKYNSGSSFPYCDTVTSEPISRIRWDGGRFGVFPADEQYPMILVTWYGAAAYCNWRSAMEGRPLCYDLSDWSCDFGVLGYRLPTEAEWEKAARGGAAGRRFPWADQDTIQHARCNYRSVANFAYDTSPTRGYHVCWGAYKSPVGFFDGSLRYRTDWNWPGAPTSFQTTNGANGYGLHDMAGNVNEWCNDWHSANFYDRSPYSNPRGPTSGTSRVLRGGGAGGYASTCRVAARGSLPPDFRYPDGFRCSLGVP